MTFFENLKEYEGMKPGLSRIKKFLKDLDNPQDSLKVVHIAGTNGKGSTAVFISNILIAAGYRTALYTSPHLIDITERISVNGKNIPAKILKDLSKKYLKKAVKYKLSYFEYLTSLSFIYFALQKVEVAVIETGLGGRFDATNIIKKPLVCAITSIAKEHQEILGNTIEQITFEKAGIIKKNCDIVCGKLPKKAELVIRSKSNPYFYGKAFKSYNNRAFGVLNQRFDYISKNLNLKNIDINLLGEHQVINASVAVCIAELLSRKCFALSEVDIKKGLKNSVWSGRFDLREVSIDNKIFSLIIDGAHNIEGLNSFFDTFKRLGFANEKKVFIFAAMKEKKYRQMIKKIAPFAEKIILPYIKNNRAINPIDLKDEFSKYISEDKIFVVNSVKEACRMFDYGKVGITIGSLYLAGEVLSVIQKHNTRRA
ncbi:folylpolyglutamate synthase/dihydrofolate synthase family protein [Candidatus Endomicrobiellum devescovinae]|jgi:dihydrofolate synthase/folylpolyglutamate synthase|uniref:bifunctional folylpolyglutamate synthase/dihydrofolate synthase n=1 Tax=Candidatus Endomicrobiellum devescovinae TaxID=3242322 RepID=UPI00281BDEB1|nr:bifunctional folylpolyglutamate synthase/dihydrofolate synthase [Endomicrobium sp.]